MKALRDVSEPALEVHQALHEQHDHVHRRQAQVVGDPDIVLAQMALETARSIEQADLVACLDPQLLRQRRSRVPGQAYSVTG
jgi:hypothetical protein